LIFVSDVILFLYFSRLDAYASLSEEFLPTLKSTFFDDVLGVLDGVCLIFVWLTLSFSSDSCVLGIF
jgi:hypothetical protein